MLFHDEHDAAFVPKPLAIIRLAHSFILSRHNDPILCLFNQSLSRSYHFNVRKLLDRSHKLTHIRPKSVKSC